MLITLINRINRDASISESEKVKRILNLGVCWRQIENKIAVTEEKIVNADGAFKASCEYLALLNKLLYYYEYLKNAYEGVVERPKEIEALERINLIAFIVDLKIQRLERINETGF